MNRPEIIEQLYTVLKNSTVITDPAVLAAYVPDNPLITENFSPIGVVRPADTGELEKLLLCANENGWNLCPVSSSKNHYQGGFTARREHLLVDLSVWKDIFRIDRRNRVCMIQPGVTYEQLLP